MNRAWTEVLVALLVAATETLIEVVKRLRKKGRYGMTELEKLVLWGTAIVAVFCLFGPAAVFRFAGYFLKCLVIFMAILFV